MVTAARILVAAGLLILVQSARGQSVLEQMEKEVTAIVRAARSGVVTIEEQVPPIEPGRVAGSKAAVTDGQKRSGAQLATPPKSGSGFSIGDGLIVTTADVLQGMQNPTVLTDSGVRFRAFTVRVDPELNIGLLRLPPKSDAPALPLGDSSSLAVGQFAITIGNQSGQPNAVALAVVAGIKREGIFAAGHFYPHLIQIAGTVAAGSSGAPLLNRKGEVVGMMAAVPAAEPENGASNPKNGKDGKDGTLGGDAPAQSFRAAVSSAGYAIPIDDLKTTIRAMRESKLYARAWVGIDLKELTTTWYDGAVVVAVTSLRVEGVYPDSPAARVGLKAGDLIRSMNGTPVHTLAEFRTAVVRLKMGDTLRLIADRDGKPVSVDIPFQIRPTAPGKL